MRILLTILAMLLFIFIMQYLMVFLPRNARNVGTLLNRNNFKWKDLLTYLKETPKRFFWRRPDHYMSAVNLGNDKVWAQIRGNYALLTDIPKPETGYFYKDMVQVEGPVGTTKFKDDDLFVYNVIKLHKKSNIPTFTFKAIVPSPKDYFDLVGAFHSSTGVLKARIPYPKENYLEWKTGYCTAYDIEIARKLLDAFVINANGRQIKELVAIKAP